MTPLGLIAGNGMCLIGLLKIYKNLSARFRAGISGEVADEVSGSMDAWVGIGQLQLARDLMQKQACAML